MDGLLLLEEILAACPGPILELLGKLVGSLDSETTQTRFVEIGPLGWWLKNIFNCPTMAHILWGDKKTTMYMLRNVSVRVTSFPDYARTDEQLCLKFVELKFLMALVTPDLLNLEPAYSQCRFRSRGAWDEEEGEYNEQGVLVSR